MTIANIPRSKRTPGNVLRELARNPLVIDIDILKFCWLRGCIDALVQLEYIKPDPEVSFPWRRYTITDKGRRSLETLA